MADPGSAAADLRLSRSRRYQANAPKTSKIHSEYVPRVVLDMHPLQPRSPRSRGIEGTVGAGVASKRRAS